MYFDNDHRCLMKLLSLMANTEAKNYKDNLVLFNCQVRQMISNFDLYVQTKQSPIDQFLLKSRIDFAFQRYKNLP